MLSRGVEENIPYQLQNSSWAKNIILRQSLTFELAFKYKLFS